MRQKTVLKQGHDFSLNQNGSDSVEELFNSNLAMICVDLAVLEYFSFSTRRVKERKFQECYSV